MLVFGFVVCSYEASTIGAFVMVNTLANSAAVLRLYFRVSAAAIASNDVLRSRAHPARHHRAPALQLLH